jgi:heat shock protein HtpX
MRRAPALRIGHDVPGACAIGFWRADICISSTLAGSLDDDELETVLLHELAHAARRDVLGSALFHFGAWTATLLTAAGLILPINEAHPGADRTRLFMLTALISFVLVRFLVTVPGRFLRELTCDDLAVRWSGDPLALASALTKVSRFDPTGGVARSGIGHREAFTIRRIRRLVDYRPAHTRHALQRAAAVATMAAMALAVLALV